MKTIVITGASSGIGKATAKVFAANGWAVAATMRRPENETELTELANIKLYRLDVTDQASIDQAVTQILSAHETVDAVLNNAGYALSGPFEAASDEQIRRQFETNVFGLIAVTRAFLPHFRAKKAGLFLNVSSIGGRITFPLMSLYHSSKWAVEGFSESLAFELAELGIQVKVIEPGGVATDFGGRSMALAMPAELPEYMPQVQKVMAAFQSRGPASSAEKIAQGIFEAATDGKTQLRYLLGEDAKRTFAMRQQVGDDAFMAGMRQQMLA